MEGAGQKLTTRQAAFIGVGAMVGAGIFSLLGAAGEVAGSAVWIAFLLAGLIALLQGYSFAKFGARYPSAGGLLEYVVERIRGRARTGIMAWLIYSVNAIVTAMVAVSFGSYASSSFADGSTAWIKVFAVGIVAAMTLLNMVGSKAVARVQTFVVYIVLGICRCSPSPPSRTSTYTSSRRRAIHPFRTSCPVSRSTFFAFLGFGVITFTAKDLADPRHQLPRAMYLALSIATIIYVAVSLGVFGTLTVKEVIDSGGTALAVAAEPTLGRAGYWLMSITALFATSGATNAGLYPATGLCDQMAAVGQFPPVMSRRVGERLSVGLLVTSVAAMVLAAGFNLNAIASIGSAVALLVFTLISAAHVRIRGETGANVVLLALGVLATGTVLVTFTFTTLVDEPGTLILLAAIIAASAIGDLAWKKRRGDKPQALQSIA